MCIFSERVPGDGEDYSDNYDDEDDVIDNLDDDYESGSDDGKKILHKFTNTLM